MLLALAADAWWDGRQDRVAEAEYLSALSAEIKDVRSDFLEHVAFLDRQIDRTSAAREILNESRGVVGPDSVSALIASIVPPRALVPPRAALDDLLVSGGLSLVRSSGLRRSLARYDQALAQDLASQDRVEELWDDFRAPYRYENTRLGLSPSGGLELEADVPAFVGNRTYQNFLVAHALRMLTLRDRHMAVLAVVEELSSALAAY